jgi:hypothetical protein
MALNYREIKNIMKDKVNDNVKVCFITAKRSLNFTPFGETSKSGDSGCSGDIFGMIHRLNICQRDMLITISAN